MILWSCPGGALQRSAIEAKGVPVATDTLANRKVRRTKVDRNGVGGWHRAGGHLPERDRPTAEAAPRHSHQPHHVPRSRRHLSARSGVPTRCPLRPHALRRVPQRPAPRRCARCPKGGGGPAGPLPAACGAEPAARRGAGERCRRDAASPARGCGAESRSVPPMDASLRQVGAPGGQGQGGGGGGGAGALRGEPREEDAALTVSREPKFHFFSGSRVRSPSAARARCAGGGLRGESRSPRDARFRPFVPRAPRRSGERICRMIVMAAQIRSRAALIPWSDRRVRSLPLPACACHGSAAARGAGPEPAEGSGRREVMGGEGASASILGLAVPLPAHRPTAALRPRRYPAAPGCAPVRGASRLLP